MRSVLFVDDDAILCMTAKSFFSAKGIEITTAGCGEAALKEIEKTRFDLIILDVIMPGENGFEVCRDIKRLCNTPVLFLTALGTEKDCLMGYESGACDFIVKPYHLSVLYEKCEQIITRYRGEHNKNHRITVAQYSLDTEKMLFLTDDVSVPLQGKEYELLLFFFMHPGVVLSREKIIDNVWGYGFPGNDRIVDTYVKKLRHSLGRHGKIISTVKNAGYRFWEGQT